MYRCLVNFNLRLEVSQPIMLSFLYEKFRSIVRFEHPYIDVIYIKEGKPDVSKTMLICNFSNANTLWNYQAREVSSGNHLNKILFKVPAQI